MPSWHLFTLNIGIDENIGSLVFCKGELFHILDDIPYGVGMLRNVLDRHSNHF